MQTARKPSANAQQNQTTRDEAVFPEDGIAVYENTHKGSVILAYISQFKNNDYVHVREWYTDKQTGKQMPGKGISVPKSKLPELAAALVQLHEENP